MLKSRNLILDTQFFIDKRFDFGHQEFIALIELVKQDLVSVYMTDITVREVHKKIIDEIGTAYTKLNVSDLRYLSIIPSFKRFKQTYNLEKLISFFKNNFESFIKKCKVVIISSAEIKVMQIFEDYCTMQPPFNDKKDKKAEFPDAFALAAILDWARKTKNKAYLLSKDNDWKLFAEKSYISFDDDRYFESLQELPSFIDLVLRNEEALKDVVNFADKLIASKADEIADYLIPKIQYSGFTSYSDAETSIFEVSILSVEVVLAEALLCDRESAVYSIDFTCTGIFGFDVTDYSEVIWDPEDRVYLGETDFTVFQKQSFELTAEIEISYADGLEKNFQIESASIESDFIINYDDDEAETLTLEDWNNQIPVLVCGIQENKITENGEGSMYFDNISEARKAFPELNITKPGKDFTQALGAQNFKPELRFETWKLFHILSD